MPAPDVAAFRQDIARRFCLVRGATRSEPAADDGPLDAGFADDGLRFWWSHSAGPQDGWQGMAPAIRARLLEPWERASAAVNRVHGRLHLPPREMLAVSAGAEQRCVREASEWADAYRYLQRDLAGPSIQLTRHVESICRDATALAETWCMRSGWHTSAAGIWLRLQHLAGCAYPLVPSFGAALWRALHLAGPPRWPRMPGTWAVRPVALRGAILEARVCAEDTGRGLAIALAARERFAGATPHPAI